MRFFFFLRLGRPNFFLENLEYERNLSYLFFFGTARAGKEKNFRFLRDFFERTFWLELRADFFLI